MIETEVTPIVTHLLNRIMSSGIYPDIYKMAIVIPINKSGDTTNVKDYRPVSILSTYNKIIEKALHRRMVEFTEGYLKIIYKRQYGFRRKASTEIAAIEMINEIQKRIDNKEKVSLIFMDLQRAFDIIDVETLLLTLNNCGIRGTALKLFESYLSNRQQIVRVNGVLSSKVTFSQGVVQGSVLGSWLFLLFINSIAELKISGQLYMYADDCVLMNIHKADEDAETAICKDMRKIINYLNAKKLILNVKKTKFMMIKSAAMKKDNIESIVVKSSENDEIKIEGEYKIERVKEMKYLGLIIDENMNWESHVKNVETKISMAAGVLWKLKLYLPQNIKIKIYKSLIETHINYMIPVWGSATDSIIHPLQVAQNRALRNVYGIDRLTNRTEMYSTMVDDNLPIRGIFYKNTAGYIFKASNKMCYTNFNFDRMHTERRGDYLRPIMSRTSIGRKSICAIGPRIFNDLPSDIQQSRNIYRFVKAIKVHLKNEEFLNTCFNGDMMARFI
jgi:hypothetical protein